MRSIIIVFALSSLMVAGAVAAVAQQRETGPKSSPSTGHPVKGPETGVRGPSNTVPETGPHGPREVTKDAEPGKQQSKTEQKQTGQVPEASGKAK